MTPKEAMYEKAGQKLVEALEKRHFTAQYCATAEEARAAILSKIGPEKVVGFGGSETMAQLGILDALRAKKQPMLDRDAVPAEERNEMMRKALLSDVFLMSSNAVTEDGCLVNLDGRGNRVAALTFGPEQVIVAVGMNKVTADLDAALKRVRHYAAPMNAQRFPGQSPCRVTGRCADCTSPDSICASLVITRLCKVPGRIHVVVIGQDLGM